MKIRDYTGTISAVHSEFGKLIPSSFCKRGTKYYITGYNPDENNVKVFECATIDGTYTAVLSNTGYSSIRLFPTIKCIDDVLYFVYQADGTTHHYTSADGTNWTETCNYADANAAIGFDIFKLSTVIYVKYWISGVGIVTIRKWDNSANYTNTKAHYNFSTFGTVVNNIYYICRFRAELAGTNDMYEVTFNGTAISDGVLCSGIAPQFVTVPNTGMYYVSAWGAKWAIISDGIWQYDKQSLTWRQNAGNSTYYFYQYDDWNTVSCVTEEGTGYFYKIYQGGGICKWMQVYGTGYGNGAAFENKFLVYNKSTYAVYFTEYPLISFSPTLIDVQPKEMKCKFRETSLDWDIDQYVEIYNDDDILIYPGFILDYSDDQEVEIESVFLTDYNFNPKVSASFAGIIDTAILDQLLADYCMFFSKGTLTSQGATTFTYTSSEAIGRQFNEVERIAQGRVYWNGAGALMLDNGATDSTSSYTFGDGTIGEVTKSHKTYAINKVIVHGNGIQVIRRKSTVVNGQTAILYHYGISNQTTLEQIADGLLAKNSAKITRVTINVIAGTYFQWGETLTLTYSPEGLSGTFYSYDCDYNDAGLIIYATSALIYDQSDEKEDMTAAVVAINEKVDGKVEDAIVDGHTTIAPSGNAVFDALALKAPLASPTFTGTITYAPQIRGFIELRPAEDQCTQPVSVDGYVPLADNDTDYGFYSAIMPNDVLAGGHADLIAVFYNNKAAGTTIKLYSLDWHGAPKNGTHATYLNKWNNNPADEITITTQLAGNVVAKEEHYTIASNVHGCEPLAKIYLQIRRKASEDTWGGTCYLGFYILYEKAVTL